MWWLLFCACADEPTPVAAPTSGTNQLLDALDDAPSAPSSATTSAEEAPTRAVPEGNTPSPEVTVTEATPACAAAEQAYADADARVTAYRERTILPAEDHMVVTAADLSDCMLSPECQAQKERFGAISRRNDDAKTAYERAYDRLPAMEAELFPLREAMLEACGGNRR